MTLRRELINKIFTLLELAYQDNPPTEHARQYNKRQAEKIADMLIEMRAFKRGSDEWKKELGNELAEKSIEATIMLGKPVKQEALNRQVEVQDLEKLIDEQLTRLGMNWQEEKSQDQDSFRKFLKAEYEEGKALDVFVNWWMSDEWRVANPPWNLLVIRKQWNKAWIDQRKPVNPVKTDKSGAPITY